MPNITDEVRALENRVAKLEGYVNIAVAVIAILGFGGAFIGTQLYSVSSKVAALKEQVNNQKKEALDAISTAGSDQIKKIEQFVDEPEFMLRVQKGMVRENTDYYIQWRAGPYRLDVQREQPPNVWVFPSSSHTWQFIPTK